MAGSSSPGLQSLMHDLARSRLSEAVKKALLKQEKINESSKKVDKPNDPESSRSTSLKEIDSLSPELSECKVKADEIRNNLEALEINSELSSCLSDPVPSENVSKQSLDMLLDVSDEEDLLCQIAVNKGETSNDNDDDEKILNYEFTNMQEFKEEMGSDKFSLSLFEKQKVPVLQIGMAIPDPVLNVEEAKFSKNVCRVLKAIRFHGPSCIQSVVWPSVERGRDILVVAPPHSGKTVSYVLPLASQFGSSDAAAEENKGPHSIILCSSWCKAQAVNEYFKLFLGEVRKKIFTLYTDGGHYKNKVQSLIINCDILIATPHCLLEFLEKRNVNFTRLEAFVVDDGSTIMGKHKKELKEIILCIMEAIKKVQCSPQLIFCTERWNKNFQIIVDKVMRNPLLFFTSFLEAAIYAKILIKAHVCDSKHMKKVAVYDIVKSCAQKVLICSSDISEASEVHLFLKRLRCKSYLVTEEMEHFVADDIIKTWKVTACESESQCLIVTDQIATDIRISANCLVHFDIPSKSRLQFGNRFSCIAEYFSNKELSSKCVSHVLVLKSDQRYAANLVEIIENSGGTPPEKLVELSKTVIKEENMSGDLCYYMKAFGVCYKSLCKNRHTVIPELDKPQIVPYEGDIHAIVTHIVDASNFYVRLVKYLDPITSKTVSLIGTYARIGFQLRDFYLHAPEMMKVDAPIIGESYVIEEENNLFYRVKVLGYIPETASQVEQWKLLYIDEGWIKNQKVPKLYKLTDEVNFPEPLAIEVYACNIAPPDSYFDWNPQTSLLVSDLLKGKEIHGKIVLCMGRTLWLDPLAVTVRLSDGHYVYPFKIDQKLLDYGHIVKRKSHLESLLKACTGKIPLPQLTKRKVIEEKLGDPELTISYAFLDCDVFEDVYVSCVVSPDQIYVQRAKFVECLDDLLDKINLLVEKKKLKRAYTVFKNMICVAPFFEDNRYYRAIVTDILSDNEVHVFYVDFGDSGTVARKDIFSLTSEFLLLPFQAIECELAGIKPSHGGWTESAINTLMMLTRDESHDMKILQLKAYSKKSSYSSGNRYLVDLWFDGRKLSEHLLQAGFCVPDETMNQLPCESSSAFSTNSPSNLDDNYSPSAEDEDMDPEDIEITTQFYEMVAKMMAEQYGVVPASERPDADDSSDDAEVLNSCNVSRLPDSDVRDATVLPKLNELKKAFPSTEQSGNSIRPLITWWDTPEELNILINLKDIKVYELDVTDESLTFNTIVAGIQYSTEEKFYEKIHSSERETNVNAQGIKIIAKKCTPFKWPRLTREKKKFFHIKYDLLHLEDSDSEESAKLKTQKSKDSSHMKYMYEDKNESTTDEEETYVEPWKDFAQYKDPVNDLLTEI